MGRSCIDPGILNSIIDVQWEPEGQKRDLFGLADRMSFATATAALPSTQHHRIDPFVGNQIPNQQSDFPISSFCVLVPMAKV
jgi:hypothetical protein